MTDRVVVLIDMDCFYCQVESRLNPKLNGKPMAVVQYNQWRGGGIIAVNYEARDRGVTRHMRGAEAKKHCPEIILVTVPTIRDKADLTRYRDAGREVLTVFCSFTDQVQRASIDEAYIDLTSLVEERMKTFSEFDPHKWKSTYVVGYSTDGSNDEEERQNGLKSWLDDCESLGNTPSQRLAVGALIVEEMRAAVLAHTGFRCSAGIAHNKILAKLACGLHKPNRQTVLPQEAVEGLYKTLPVRKIRNLGGKFGEEIAEKLGCQTMGDLAKYSEKELQNKYDEKTGTWLYNIARGYDHEPVTARLVSKSIGCCKKFPGRQALIKSDDVYHWLNKLVEELYERLLEDETMNKRRAQLLTVSTALEINRVDCACSKSIALSSYSNEKIVALSESLLKKMCKVDSSGLWSPPIKYLGLSAGKFCEISINKIDKFFSTSNHPNAKSVTETKKEEKIAEGSSKEENKLSFFEKMFAKELNNSGKKLCLVPDLSKNDLFVDSDDSQSSSLFKNRPEVASDSSREIVKKQLFNNSDFSEVQTNKPTSGQNPLIQSKKETKNIVSTAKKKSTESSSNNIAAFFGNMPKKDSRTKPEELFPNVDEVDDELLSYLPESYRKYILSKKCDKKLLSNCSSLPQPQEPSSSNLEDTSGLFDNLDKPRSPPPFELPKTPSGDTSRNLGQMSPEDIFAEDCETDTPPVSFGLVKCDECGKEVPDLELHMDLHLAQKLHKELNSFTNATIRTPPTVVNDNDNKKKRRSKTKFPPENAKKMKSIEAFFVKR